MILLKAAVLVFFLSIIGCASAEKYLGTTEASFGDLKWKSNKNQENLDAKFKKDGEKVEFDIKTTATTPEAAIAAAAQANAEAWKNFSEVMKELLPLIKKGAAAGS